MSVPSSITSLRDLYEAESARIQGEFKTASDGRKATRDHASLVDQIVLDLTRVFLPPDVERVCLIAIGGYGRRALFPYSDVDLLYLCEDDATLKRHHEAMRSIS